MTKMLKVTISGSYLASNKETVDFDEITGFIPVVSDEKAAQYVRKRYSVMWLKSIKKDNGDKVFPKRIEKMRQVHIDDIKEVDGEQFSYVGKDIKKMSYDELQDLSIAKDLNRIPLPKEISGVDVRRMRTMAYIEYSDKILNNFINHNDQDFNFAKLPELIVDANIRQDNSEKITNDEILNQEMNSKTTESVKSNLTLNDLKGIANEKNVRFHPNIGFDALHAKLYGGSDV
jgi:hypothetical protein